MGIAKILAAAALVLLLPVHRAFAVTEAEALNMIAVIDKNEMQAAELAMKKTNNGPVLDFARMMDKDHSENLDQTVKLAGREGLALEDTAAVKGLRDQGAKDLQDLGMMEGKQFETSYMAAMVKGHADALQLIDQQLLPAVQNPDVKKHLEQTRKSVEAHLNKARAVQSAQAKEGE